MITTQLVPDFSIRMQINGLTISCIHKEFGCTFSDAVSRIFQHEFICEYKQVECKQCEEEVSAIDLPMHILESCKNRLIVCEKCNFKVPFHQLESHRDFYCIMLPCICNYCGHNFLVKELQSHLEQCGSFPVHCTYQSYGCTFSGIRSEIEKHESDPIHMPLLKKSLEEYKEEIKVCMNHMHGDGPFRVEGHAHSVLLCSDGEGEHCSHCQDRIEKQGLFLFYKCSKGCNFQLCTPCLQKKRQYRSKKDNLSLFFLQL